MKRPAATKAQNQVALALTWDGARWPEKKLSSKARAFLKGPSKSLRAPIPKKLSVLFVDDAIDEIRICWVPQLKGGKEVLAEPFATPKGKRLKFVVTHTIRLDEALGVIYSKKTR